MEAPATELGHTAGLVRCFSIPAHPESFSQSRSQILCLIPLHAAVTGVDPDSSSAATAGDRDLVAIWSATLH